MISKKMIFKSLERQWNDSEIWGWIYLLWGQIYQSERESTAHDIILGNHPHLAQPLKSSPWMCKSLEASHMALQPQPPDRADAVKASVYNQPKSWGRCSQWRKKSNVGKTQGHILEWQSQGTHSGLSLLFVKRTMTQLPHLSERFTWKIHR